MQNIVQGGNVVIVKDNKVIINGDTLPPLPTGKRLKSIGSNIAVINNRIYVDGYEYKNGKWKRTLRALYYMI